MPWPWLELAKDDFAEDGDAVAPVEGDGTDVEDTSDGGVGPEPDQIDGNAPKNRDPDGIKGCARTLIDNRPDP